MVLLKDVKVHASIFGAATLAVVAGCIGVAVVAAIEELPFGRTVIALVKGITTHAAIAGENGEFLTEAKRRANRVKSLLDELDAADFPNGSPAFAAVVDALVKLFSLAGRWTQKSWAKKHFGVSVRNGTTSAAHYKAEFEACFNLLEWACKELLEAVAVGTFARAEALRKEFSASTIAHGASLQDIGARITELAKATAAAEERADARLTEMMESLKSEMQAALAAGGSVAKSTAAVAAAAAGRAAEELGLNEREVQRAFADATIPKILTALEEDGAVTREAVAEARRVAFDQSRALQEEVRQENCGLL